MSVLPSPSSVASAVGCRLVSTDGQILPLRVGALQVSADAGLARVVLRQTFHNPHPEPLRVTYAVPLPADAAVSGFAFEIAGARTVGVVDTLHAARERFEEALLDGRTAALLEETRSSVFQQEVGNIPPGEDVVCELILDQRLRWQGGRWEWRFPTVVAPRYLGEIAHTAEAERLTVPVSEGDTGATVSLAMRVHDPLTGPVDSPSHALHLVDGEIGLTAESAPLDRDVVVRWSVAQPTPGARLIVGTSDKVSETHGLLTLVPPETPMVSVPRDLILLLDTSGSMSGAPLNQAKAVSVALIESLQADDTLQIIEFSNRPRSWRIEPVQATAANRGDAAQWVRSLSAGGGTEMRTGILAALNTLRDEARRQVVLVTDGLIGAEKQIIGAIRSQLPSGSRVHTLGIGRSTNRTLLSGVARAGGGLEIIVDIDADPAKAAADLVDATADPQVVDLQLSGDALVQVENHRLPDLTAGRPTTIAVRLRPEGGMINVYGRTAAGRWSQTIPVAPAGAGPQRASVVPTVGRVRVETLELRAAVGENVDTEIEAIGLAYQIATRRTAWVAVSEAATVNPQLPGRRVNQPQNLPSGMSAVGLGLRAPSLAPPPQARGMSANRSHKRSARRRALSAKPPSSPVSKGARELDLGSAAIGLPEGYETPARRRETSESGGGGDRGIFRSSRDQNVPRRALRGRVVLQRAGKLVVEITVHPDALDWSPVKPVWVLLSDGRRLRVAVDVPRSTGPGTVTAGQILRLTLKQANIPADRAAVVSVEFVDAGGAVVSVTLK
ncbi:MAG: VIT domain-containing protein [Myxococcota bacterium]